MDDPAPPDPTEYSFYDKSSGRERRFQPLPGQAVVRFDAQARDEALRTLVAAPAIRSVSAGVDMLRGYAAVHLAGDRDARDVTEIPIVADALPVMVDQEGLLRYFLPDELTVQFAARVDPSEAEQLISRFGSRVLVRQRTRGYYTVTVPDGDTVFSAIRRFNEHPDVAFAEPSEVGFNDALYVPDDPDFGSLWGLQNTGQSVNGTTGTAGIDISAVAAWDLHRGDPRVIVAVIDTGADLDHPDLAPNILPRGSEDWDFADTGDPSPDDDDGHGTHVAGTAAASDNDVGIVGVSHRCSIMPLRIDLSAGVNQNRADAINYVAQQAGENPDWRYVANCSWRTSGDHAGVRNAISNAVSAGVLVVFAAGNADTNTDVTPQYPGVYPTVISVAAIDQNGLKATFSNFGTNVDVSAPGVNVFSSLPDDAHGLNDGTSMAAPHVAGLAALVWSAVPALTNTQVRYSIESTCDDVDVLNPGFIGLLGHGRANAFAAVKRAQWIGSYVPSIPSLA